MVITHVQVVYYHSQRYSAPPCRGRNFRRLPFIAELAFFRGILQKNPISEHYRSQSWVSGRYFPAKRYVYYMNTLIILVTTQAGYNVSSVA